MGKIMALDLGDQWIGSAISDSLRIFARPFKTVRIEDLHNFIVVTTKEENIKDIVIGYPKTMRGGESDQTRKVLSQKEKLVHLFPELNFILWDERLSSQRAKTINSDKSKDAKLKSHSYAAAFILDSYLSYLQNKKLE